MAIRLLVNSFTHLRMKKIFLIALFALISLQACENEIFSPIPYAPVNLKLDLRFRDAKLNSVWASQIFTSGTPDLLATDRLGFGGILVINGVGDAGINLFAYDLACPVEVNKAVRVVPDDIGHATCPQCHAVYYIANGSGAPMSGTKNFLKAYQVTLKDELNLLYLVSN
jgi:hypothetical protein